MRWISMIAALGCAAFACSAAAQPRPQVTIAVVPSVPSASTYIAQDKGYFRDAGIDVKIETIDTLAKAIAFIANNQVQVGQGGLNAGYFNAVAQGLPAIIVMDGASTPLYHRLLLRPGLAGKIKSARDLKGLRIAANGPGSTSVYEISAILASAGLTIKDIDLKYLAFAQMGPALANDALDAGLSVAPFTDVALKQKMAVAWIDPEDGYIKSLPMTNVAYVANTDWIKKQPDVARKLFVALARGGRDYCQAYHHGPNRAEVIDIMLRNKLSTDKEQLEQMDWQARNPDGKVNLPALASVQTFFKQAGFIDNEAPLNKIVDDTFASAAAKQLGKFEVTNKSSKLEGCR